MTRRREQLVLAAEIGWLLVSTSLLLSVAVAQSGHWRLMWLMLLVVNAAVVGYRVMRMTQHLRAAKSRA
jgi:hypothetical protein